ncbi:MAG: CPBP family intramembrane metalloprotease [Burkholderiales bacterium]|nr:CPBP family intramembrane metalloprotease [Burkholderiales bacterium]
MPLPDFQWRLATALWLLGLPGVVAASLMAVPRLLPPGPLPAPLSAIMAAAALQAAVLLAAAALLGAMTARRVGLHSPFVEAMAIGARPPSMRAPVAAGAIGGILGAGLLLALPLVEPARPGALGGATSLPLVVRLLYGGITEEIIVRWGLMSGTLWVLWKSCGVATAAPGALLTAGAVVVSSILFGIGHLPAAAALADGLDAGVVLYIVCANALFGLLAGYLFRRHGLESAITAHLLAHLGAWACGR